MTFGRGLALLAIAGAAVLVLVLALRTRQPPLLPADGAHADRSDMGDCVACHDPGGPAPRGKDHPLGLDCLRCHGVR